MLSWWVGTGSGREYLLGNQWTCQAQRRLVVVEMGRGGVCDVIGWNSLHGLRWGRAQVLLSDVTA